MGRGAKARDRFRFPCQDRLLLGPPRNFSEVCLFYFYLDLLVYFKVIKSVLETPAAAKAPKRCLNFLSK